MRKHSDICFIVIQTSTTYIFQAQINTRNIAMWSFDNVRPSSEKSVVADFVGTIANDVMETQKSIIVVCRYGVN
jgi:hypothetical protein